jgi:hypothetical protein
MDTLSLRGEKMNRLEVFCKLKRKEIWDHRYWIIYWTACAIMGPVLNEYTGWIDKIPELIIQIIAYGGLAIILIALICWLYDNWKEAGRIINE